MIPTSLSGCRHVRQECSRSNSIKSSSNRWVSFTNIPVLSWACSNRQVAATGSCSTQTSGTQADSSNRLGVLGAHLASSGFATPSTPRAPNYPNNSLNSLTLPNLLLQSAVFTNTSVLATFLSMHSQGLRFGTFPGQALDLPGSSQFGYAPATPTDDSYCLFATQPDAPAPSPATLLPGAPTAGSPLPGAFACFDASTKPPPTPDSFTLSYAGTTYVCHGIGQGTPGPAPSPIGRKLQPALAPVEDTFADTLTAVGS